jgi:hypothetical protein
MKLPFSYTHLRSAEQCLRQYHRVYVLKDVPFVETDAARWGTTVHRAMERRLRDGIALIDGMQIYEQFVPSKTGRLRGLVEYKMGMRSDGTHCDFFAADVWCRGKLDFALVEHDAKSACIVDWKIGKVREDPDELEIYAVMLRAKYPHIDKLTGWYVWLKEERMGKLHELSDTNGKLESLKHRVQRLAEVTALDHWPPQQGPLCPWCAVKQCEFHP